MRIGYLTTDSAVQPYYEKPFSVNSGTSGAFKIVNKNFYKVKVDYDILYCNDIDAIFQELISNRIVLHPNYFISSACIDTNKGGMSSDRKRKYVFDSIAKMENKWGKYFSYDFDRNTPHIKVKR